MSKPILIEEKAAKRSLAVLMERAHFGQEFVITRDGVPYAKLISDKERLRTNGR